MNEKGERFHMGVDARFKRIEGRTKYCKNVEVRSMLPAVAIDDKEAFAPPDLT